MSVITSFHARRSSLNACANHTRTRTENKKMHQGNPKTTKQAKYRKVQSELLDHHDPLDDPVGQGLAFESPAAFHPHVVEPVPPRFSRCQVQIPERTRWATARHISLRPRREILVDIPEPQRGGRALRIRIALAKKPFTLCLLTSSTGHCFLVLGLVEVAFCAFGTTRARIDAEMLTEMCVSLRLFELILVGPVGQFIVLCTIKTIMPVSIAWSLSAAKLDLPNGGAKRLATKITHGISADTS